MPRKRQTSDGPTACIWSDVMNDALVDGFLNQQNIGNRVNGTFTTHAVDHIVNELKEKFPDKPIDKERVHNRMKNIKRHFTKWCGIFQSGLSGFVWDRETEMFSAEEELWQQLIEVCPAAAELKNKRVRNYDKLLELYGKDGATGKGSDVPSDMRRKAVHNARKRNDDPSSLSIDEIDQIVSENACNLKAFDECEAGANYEYAPAPHTPTSQVQPEPTISRTKRLKQNSRDDILDVLKSGLSAIATAIRDLSTKPPVSGSDLWGLVSSLSLDRQIETKSYMTLLRDRDMLIGFIGIPLERRKEFLLEMMFGGGSGRQ